MAVLSAIFQLNHSSDSFNAVIRTAIVQLSSAGFVQVLKNHESP